MNTQVPYSEEATKPDMPQYFDILSSMRGRRVILDLGMLLDFLKIDVVCGKCRKGNYFISIIKSSIDTQYCVSCCYYSIVNFSLA